MGTRRCETGCWRSVARVMAPQPEGQVQRVVEIDAGTRWTWPSKMRQQALDVWFGVGRHFPPVCEGIGKCDFRVWFALASR
jgi:hypothetical protein